jgi:hypothetical protein
MKLNKKRPNAVLVQVESVSSIRANNALIGIAGVHHVVSELSRRGLIALPTVRNTAAYDVVVVTTDGTRHANIQVKASSKRVSFFRMPTSKRVMAGPCDYYVLLRWDDREGKYDVMMLTGAEARAEVLASETSQQRRIESGSRNVLVPCITIVGSAAARAEKWRERWACWRL